MISAPHFEDLELESDPDLACIRSYWERAVGRFVLAFGVIENCSFALVLNVAGMSFEEAEDMTIGGRLKLARTRYRQLGLSGPIALIDDALELVAVRNVIAHGRLRWVEETDDQCSALSSFMSSPRRSSERLFLPDLEQYAERAKLVGAELFKVDAAKS